jgi:hypothetical protein
MQKGISHLFAKGGNIQIGKTEIKAQAKVVGKHAGKHLSFWVREHGFNFKEVLMKVVGKLPRNRWN